jgi:hypothetical protein
MFFWISESFLFISGAVLFFKFILRAKKNLKKNDKKEACRNS